MPTKNPRINIVIDEPTRKAVERLANRDKVSLSLKARDLIRLALELEEDVALALLADERSKTLRGKKTLSHDEVWGT